MSIPVPLHGFSSGNAVLNFKIASYGTKEALLADKPAVNTLGVITNTKISSWILAPTTPADLGEGMLWIQTGNASPAAFNALKKNAVMLNPVSCYQRINGALVQKEAYLRTANGWVLFGNVKTYLIKDGVIDLAEHPLINTDWNPIGTYDGTPAVVLYASNGGWIETTISNVSVPEGATTFTIEYYKLASYEKNPMFTLGGVTVEVDRAGELSILDGQISMDVSGIAGMTVDFTCGFMGCSGNEYSYLKNAWFE